MFGINERTNERKRGCRNAFFRAVAGYRMTPDRKRNEGDIENEVYQTSTAK
jgi:hypothetical protein